MNTSYRAMNAYYLPTRAYESHVTLVDRFLGDRQVLLEARITEVEASLGWRAQLHSKHEAQLQEACLDARNALLELYAWYPLTNKLVEANKLVLHRQLVDIARDWRDAELSYWKDVHDLRQELLDLQTPSRDIASTSVAGKEV